MSPRDRILDDLLDFSRICRTRARNLPRNKPTIGILALSSLSSSDQGERRVGDLDGNTIEWR